MGSDAIFNERETINIGSGEYGEVKKATYLPDNIENSAIKIMNLGHVPQRENYIRSIQDRISRIRQFNSRYITKYYSRMDVRDGYLLHFGMEYCRDNLKKYIEKQRNAIDIGQIYDILFQLNKAFQIMKDNDIVHGNIKLENILVNPAGGDKYEFKLSGFETIPELIRLTKEKRPENICKYLPPEILKESKRNFNIDSSMDLWSVGLIIYYLCFNSFPYNGESAHEVLADIQNKKLEKTNFYELDDLVSGLLNPEKSVRFNWDQYLRHPFFNDDGFWKKYNIESEIGRGQVSIVYKAINKNSRKNVAIKVIDFKKIDELLLNKNLKKEKKEIINELKNRVILMEKLKDFNENSKYFIEIYEKFELDNSFSFAMELYKYNLKEFIDKSNSNMEEVQSFDLLEFLLELNKSLKILVNNNIIIGNLKLENILLNGNNENNLNYRLTDVGLCQNLIKLLKKSSEKESLIYLSPESNNYQAIDDLYSLGIIIYYYKYKNFPFNEVYLTEAKNQIKLNDSSSNFHLIDLIDALLEKNPKKRITWEKYFNHPFFTERDYSRYYKIEKIFLEAPYFSIIKVNEIKTGQRRMLKLIDKQKIRDQYYRNNLVNIDENDLDKLIELIKQQASTMEYLGSKIDNTVKYFDKFETKKELAVILEQCDSNLGKELYDRPDNFSLEEISSIFKQLNNTFSLMYEKNLIHGNLKLENIIILKTPRRDDNKSCIYKLTDYGLNNEFLHFTEKFLDRNGAPRFTAPEVLKEGNYSTEGDLWSVGIIMYILHFKKFPYEGNSSKEVLKKITLNGQNCLESSKNPEFDNLIRRLLKMNPSERITWKQYFQHPFFVGGDGWKFYRDKRFIDRGPYYQVYEVFVKETNEKRAIKVMDLKMIRQSFQRAKLRNCTDEEMNEYIKDFIKECENMDLLRGKKKDNINALIFYEYFQTKNEFCIVQELCDGNLNQMIFERKKLKIKDVNQIYQILSQLNNTFRILQKNNLSHKDLKLENILVNMGKNKEQNIYKLTGLEFNRKVDDLLSGDDIVLNERYRAPEQLDNEFNMEDIPPEKIKTFYQKADLWSLGIIIFILYFGQFPFEGNKPEVILKNIIKNENSRLNEINDSDLKDLLTKLLNEDADERIGWDEYFSHPFFSEKRRK